MLYVVARYSCTGAQLALAMSHRATMASKHWQRFSGWPKTGCSSVCSDTVVNEIVAGELSGLMVFLTYHVWLARDTVLSIYQT